MTDRQMPQDSNYIHSKAKIFVQISLSRHPTLVVSDRELYCYAVSFTGAGYLAVKLSPRGMTPNLGSESVTRPSKFARSSG